MSMYDKTHYNIVKLISLQLIKINGKKKQKQKQKKDYMVFDLKESVVRHSKQTAKF